MERRGINHPYFVRKLRLPWKSFLTRFTRRGEKVEDEVSIDIDLEEMESAYELGAAKVSCRER